MNHADPLLKKSQDTRQSQHCLPKKYFAIFIIFVILIFPGIIAFPLTSIACSILDCDENYEEPNVSKTAQIQHSTGIGNFNASSCGRRIVGYFNGWESREVSQSQLSKLTHLIYATLSLASNGSIYFDSVKSRRQFDDVISHSRYSNSVVKLMVSIGGSSYSRNFPIAVRDHSQTFVNSTISFIKEYKIDGVDIYWDAPNSDGSDKESYVNFVKDLRIKLTQLQLSLNRSDPYLLTVLTPAYGWTLEDGVDLEGLSKYVNFFNVASDDYLDSWSDTLGFYTRHHAPLYSGSGEKHKQNVDWTMRYYTCKTKKPSMLNLGLPFFGRSWKNVLEPITSSDPMWRRVQTVNGTVEKNLNLWKNLRNEGWNLEEMKWNEKTKSSYIWDPNQKSFLGIDDERSLIEKMNYVKKKNLGGVMIWSVEMDDYSETLLNAVASVDLCNMSSYMNTIQYNCN